MTQAEKARAYDEALKRAKISLDDKTISNIAIAYIKDIFPELAELEDEKTKKGIISFLRSKNGYMTPNEDWDFHNRWLPWLEKQGDKPQGKTALEAIHEEKVDNAIKVEQKPYGQKEECFNCQFNYAGHCKGYCELKKQGEKPKWTEEDEGMMNHCIGAIHIAGCHVTNSYTAKDKKAMKDWLKSLKQKIGE